MNTVLLYDCGAASRATTWASNVRLIRGFCAGPIDLPARAQQTGVDLREEVSISVYLLKWDCLFELQARSAHWVDGCGTCRGSIHERS